MTHRRLRESEYGSDLNRSGEHLPPASAGGRTRPKQDPRTRLKMADQSSQNSAAPTGNQSRIGVIGIVTIDYSQSSPVHRQSVDPLTLTWEFPVGAPRRNLLSWADDTHWLRARVALGHKGRPNLLRNTRVSTQIQGTNEKKSPRRTPSASNLLGCSTQSQLGSTLLSSITLVRLEKMNMTGTASLRFSTHTNNERSCGS
jgi:hypothetical protein